MGRRGVHGGRGICPSSLFSTAPSGPPRLWPRLGRSEADGEAGSPRLGPLRPNFSEASEAGPPRLELVEVGREGTARRLGGWISEIWENCRRYGEVTLVCLIFVFDA